MDRHVNEILLISSSFVAATNPNNSGYAVAAACPNAGENVIEWPDIVIVWPLTEVRVTNDYRNLLEKKGKSFSIQSLKFFEVLLNYRKNAWECP